MAANKADKKFVPHDKGLLPNIKPRGKAEPRPEERLEAMTTPDNLASFLDEANEDWKENAPRQYRRILDSELTDQPKS